MILTINGGSSSIKFSLYEIKEPLKQLLSGAIENIGTNNSQLNFSIIDQEKKSISIDG
jgi:acetate kinase